MVIALHPLSIQANLPKHFLTTLVSAFKESTQYISLWEEPVKTSHIFKKIYLISRLTQKIFKLICKYSYFS